MPRAPFDDRDWWRGLMRDSFGGDFKAFLAAAVLAGAGVLALKGWGVFVDAVMEDVARIGGLVPRIVAAVSVAGLLWAMLPRDRMAKLIGPESSWRGLVVGTVGGVVTPGGPASAFPLLAMLGGAGADRGALVAYIVAWSTMGLQRILVWDVPFMGTDFSLTRFLISLPLPILAGLIARRLPFSLTLREVEDDPRRVRM